MQWKEDEENTKSRTSKRRITNTHTHTHIICISVWSLYVVWIYVNNIDRENAELNDWKSMCNQIEWK